MTDLTKLTLAEARDGLARKTFSSTELTRAFLALAPERMLWGTDWPHPTESVKPDAALMLDRFVEWAASEAVVRRVLVDNPASVYGFAATG